VITTRLHFNNGGPFNITLSCNTAGKFNPLVFKIDDELEFADKFTGNGFGLVFGTGLKVLLTFGCGCEGALAGILHQ
jgi:hypothetical protein